ncbi:MAG: dihydroxyacetone kinase subunit DhaK, partial [Oscillospiraceae bacterium]|nr:dihydroxyacetone kinase subunit DhaK [Oscillospiraceae bacterium]
MKKIINNPNDVVTDTLTGLVLANDSLCLIKEHWVVYKRERRNKVGLVSGGGSGHEPAQSGYVGNGMLDAVVAGNVFASPGPEAILQGIKKANTGKGVLLVVTNYSGDIMNFDMAKELAEAEGITVDSVIVNDDVAVPNSTYSTGRRGIAGTVLVHKIAGAKSETGSTLNEVKAVAQKTVDNMRSMGMALSSCIIPSVGTPGFMLAEDEIEIGMGVHGEPGVERSTIRASRDIAEILLAKILDDYDYVNCEVALLVNGLGGTSLMELYILSKDTRKLLEQKQ